ncbi:hypothetical protein LWI28_011314 [Acer negundo]|uniref:Growth-regulating factor n=1 Tax=Acer negundo TaxID=4023 RepID=A0AAD5NZG6_ACENE|nr:hypothetical protein LWI28_011314 [Acer negundo]
MGTRSDFVGKMKGVCVEENQTSSGHKRERLMVVSPDNNSSDQMAATSVPFTADQRQELDRQTMIFKYMVAGVPVPPELILAMINGTPSTAAHSQSNSGEEVFINCQNKSNEAGASEGKPVRSFYTCDLFVFDMVNVTTI